MTDRTFKPNSPDQFATWNNAYKTSGSHLCQPRQLSSALLASSGDHSHTRPTTNATTRTTRYAGRERERNANTESGAKSTCYSS